ncbi:MAG: hypothetical protein N4A37_03240 [Prolixibacteraceae bacterium]|nr:hypothetical protein [Prolixibacteraceae bacterium]
MHILRGQMTREEQIFMFYNWFAGYQCMDASIEKKNGATTYRAFGFSWQEDQDHAKNSSKPQQFLSETKLIVYANLDYMIPELRYVVEKYRDKCNRIEFHDDTQKARLSASLRKNGLESEDTNFINTIYDNGKRLYRILKIGNSNSIDYPDKQTLETIISVLIK